MERGERRKSKGMKVIQKTDAAQLGGAASKWQFTADDLTFYNWHEAPPWARSRLRSWVWGMQPVRDGESGGQPGGAGSWLDEKIALSSPGSLFQTFMAAYQEEVVWTGSVVKDDRDCRGGFEAMGYPVDAFFGLFNTRKDLRGRGIGWAGANYANRYVWETDRGWKKICVGLFTANAVAERHYAALGFKLVGDVYISAFGIYERAYVKAAKCGGA
jgi:GNAT superfamily N-acetyltransferase